MTKEKNEAQLEKKIGKLKEKIAALGEMHPGSLSKQYNICGNPTCKCKDPDNPVKHGPYYNLSYTFRGRSKTKFIRQELVRDFVRYTSAYKKFKHYVDELVQCNVDLINLRTTRL